MDDRQELSPFLKWAGGKRWLVDDYSDLFPSEYGRYIEPFLGGGSVFFHLRPHNALLADINQRLIETYIQIRDDWRALRRTLLRHARAHNSHYYYEERERKRRSAVERAAQFIYLNRTCWNGLYRVNLNGEFNVPRGTKSTVVLESDDFSETSDALKGSTILCQDFESTIAEARENDFVYVDPPYTVNHNLNGFLKYNEKIFCWDDQVRLRDAVVAAVARGAKVAVSNANHESIRKLYSGIGKRRVLGRKSVIASSSANRGAVSELLISVC